MWIWVLVCTGTGVMLLSTILIARFYKSELITRVIISLHNNYKNHPWLFWLPALCYNFAAHRLWWKTSSFFNTQKNYVEDKDSQDRSSSSLLSHDGLDGVSVTQASNRALEREKELEAALQRLKDIEQQREHSLSLLYFQRQELNAKLIQKFSPVLISQVAEERKRFNDWCEQVD